MYRIRSVSGNQWEIVDEDDRVRFAGTPDECEALLDSVENLESRVTWLQSLIDWLRHPTRRGRHGSSSERPTSVGR